MNNLIARLPKAELHLHIEGTFEPELMFEIATRNKIDLPYSSVEELREAYQFQNLQDFLDIYYTGMDVLLKEQDFEDLTYAYFKRSNEDNLRHAEIFFDPQGHTERGVAFETAMNGILSGMKRAKDEFGISSLLILSFLRHLSEESAFQTLEQALPYKENFVAVGLDSSELGNPPEKFQRVFQRCIDLGFKTVAHAGEEGPSQYITDTLDFLKVSRIDHGNRCLEDESLVERLVREEIPLTICPLSNHKLKVVEDLDLHPLKKLMEKGLKVTVNSDDPAYFGGYLNDNYFAMAEHLNLSEQEVRTLVKNSFEASFLSQAEIQSYINQIDRL